MDCIPHQILFGWSNQEGRDGLGMWHVWERGVALCKPTRFW